MSWDRAREIYPFEIKARLTVTHNDLHPLQERTLWGKVCEELETQRSSSRRETKRPYVRLQLG